MTFFFTACYIYMGSRSEKTLIYMVKYSYWCISSSYMSRNYQKGYAFVSIEKKKTINA